jgi:hypothetical protein
VPIEVLDRDEASTDFYRGVKNLTAANEPVFAALPQNPGMSGGVAIPQLSPGSGNDCRMRGRGKRKVDTSD